MENLTHRVCCLCKENKPIEQFTKDKHDKTGYTYSCTKCRYIREKKRYQDNPEAEVIRKQKAKERHRIYSKTEQGIINSRRSHLKRTFGISLELYNEMLKNQNGVCAICKQFNTHGQHAVLAVDHCHDTGNIRGLLCYKCNTALGQFQDNINNLEKAISYLKQYGK